MTKKQEAAREMAILSMPEMTIKVLWEKVVIRGRGLNFQVGSIDGRRMGVAETVAILGAS